MSAPTMASATSSLPPSTSTLSMSPDRGLLGKIVGHLYIASRILIEGRVRPIEEIRHEIRVLMTGNSPDAPASTSTGTSTTSTAPGSVSLPAWDKLVVRMLRTTGSTSTTTSTLTDDIKRELAGLIKQGKTLGSASNDAATHLAKAGEKYLKLSGVSYL